MIKLPSGLMGFSGLQSLNEKHHQYQVLVTEKLEQWDWMMRFIELNPDVKLRWEQHKTYEILKNEQTQK